MVWFRPLKSLVDPNRLWCSYRSLTSKQKELIREFAAEEKDRVGTVAGLESSG